MVFCCSHRHMLESLMWSFGYCTLAICYCTHLWKLHLLFKRQAASMHAAQAHKLGISHSQIKTCRPHCMHCVDWERLSDRLCSSGSSKQSKRNKNSLSLQMVYTCTGEWNVLHPWTSLYCLMQNQTPQKLKQHRNICWHVAWYCSCVQLGGAIKQ